MVAAQHQPARVWPPDAFAGSPDLLATGSGSEQALEAYDSAKIVGQKFWLGLQLQSIVLRCEAARKGAISAAEETSYRLCIATIAKTLKALVEKPPFAAQKAKSCIGRPCTTMYLGCEPHG
jgi:hypothetical protein